jgi:hypothetical protein
MANAHALEEGCRPIVEEMISQGGAKAIAVASSYGDASERVFLDSPSSPIASGADRPPAGRTPVELPPRHPAAGLSFEICFIVKSCG